MSLLGLLGSAMSGAGTSGANWMAQEKERKDKEKLVGIQDARQRALEQVRFNNNMEVAKFEAGERAKQNAAELASRERLAAMKSATAKEPRIHWQKTTDGMGGETTTPYILTEQGLMPVPMGGQSPVQDTASPEYRQRRDAYIKARLDEVDGGWFGIGDSLDPWGGSEEKAKIDFGKEFDAANGQDSKLRPVPTNGVNLPGRTQSPDPSGAQTQWPQRDPRINPDVMSGAEQPKSSGLINDAMQDAPLPTRIGRSTREMTDAAGGFVTSIPSLVSKLGKIVASEFDRLTTSQDPQVKIVSSRVISAISRGEKPDPNDVMFLSDKDISDATRSMLAKYVQ